MQTGSGVAIFWDFETAKIGGERSGYQIARNLSSIADQFGVVKSFRTYLDVMNQLDPNFLSIRKQLYSSGVTMVDCPSHSGRDIADKVIIVDMLSFILDQAPPYTIVVATSDNDLCFTLAVLRRRRYKVVLVCPLQRDCENLAMQADEIQRVDWVGAGSGNTDNLSSSSPSSPSSSGILSYADFDTRHSVQNSITNDRKVGFTTEQSKKPNSLQIPHLKPVGNGLDIGSQPSDGGMTPSPDNSPHDVRDTEKPRDHTGTFSDPFFPPAPSFPLEKHPNANVPATRAHKSVAGRKSPSPQSTEEFSVVDHPRGSPPNLASRSSLVPTPISVAHQALARTHFPATSSSASPKASSHSVPVPVATQSTGNPPTPTLVTSNTEALLTTASPSVPAAISLITAAPIATATSVPAPALTSTIQTKKASEPAVSRSLPVKYRKLVQLLQVYHRSGEPWPNGSKIAEVLLRENSRFYELVGVKKWGLYTSQAVADGVIVIKKSGKISLTQRWMNVIV